MEQMSLVVIAAKIIGGACIVALSFWTTLTLLAYREGTTSPFEATAQKTGLQRIDCGEATDATLR
jgi:hypothetical protein